MICIILKQSLVCQHYHAHNSGGFTQTDAENEDFENEEVSPRVRNEGREAWSFTPLVNFAGVDTFQMPPRPCGTSHNTPMSQDTTGNAPPMNFALPDMVAAQIAQVRRRNTPLIGRLL
jgi:hypothetical protein